MCKESSAVAPASDLCRCMGDKLWFSADVYCLMLKQYSLETLVMFLTVITSATYAYWALIFPQYVFHVYVIYFRNVCWYYGMPRFIFVMPHVLNLYDLYYQLHNLYSRIMLKFLSAGSSGFIRTLACYGWADSGFQDLLLLFHWLLQSLLDLTNRLVIDKALVLC